MKNTPHTLVVDGYGIAYAAHHTPIATLTNDDGERCGVAFGVLRSIVLLMEHAQTNLVATCWDKHPLLRKKIYPGYKANRIKELSAEQLENLRSTQSQIELLVNKVLPAMGFVNTYRHEGYEADDLIASVVRFNDVMATIASSDKDMYQLLRRGRARIINPHTHRFFTEDTLLREHSVTPQQWFAASLIAGCRGDGVPGVPGVAMPTAINYLHNKLPKKRMVAIGVAAVGVKALNTRLMELPMARTPLCTVELSGLRTDGWQAPLDLLKVPYDNEIWSKKRWLAAVQGDFK